MSDNAGGLAPTSNATTADTEPEVLAGIASGNLHSDRSLSLHDDRPWGWGRTLLFLAGGVAAGFTIAMLTRGKD